MRNFNPAPFIAVAAVVTFAAGPAAAHARLVSANPAPNSTVAATQTLTLTFSERSVAAFPALTSSMRRGRRSHFGIRLLKTVKP